jgi:hypothetical protein
MSYIYAAMSTVAFEVSMYECDKSDIQYIRSSLWCGVITGEVTLWFWEFNSIPPNFLQSQWTEIGGMNFRDWGVSDENMVSKLRCMSTITKLKIFHFTRINLHFNINTRMNFSPLTSYKNKLISNLLYLSEYRYIHNMKFFLQNRNFKIIQRDVE